jgi:hypothetical protein
MLARAGTLPLEPLCQLRERGLGERKREGGREILLPFSNEK